ncbi:hypothetical protein HMPREF9466_03197, partial [Fusobacterium necrophorum subsp. funduliforme 1_1_36S]
MSQSYLIKSLFDIQDKNITFFPLEIEKEYKYHTFSKVISAILTKDTCACPHCHSQKTVKMALKHQKFGI